MYLLNDKTTFAFSAENPTGIRNGGTRGKDCEKLRPMIMVEPRNEVTLCDVDGPGMISHMWFTGDVNHAFILRIYWENNAFPSVEAHAVKVKKAVCAIAEALYWIDIQRRASSAQKAEDGSYRGAVASISSGRESISFAVSGANGSVYAAAAASAEAQASLIGSVAAQYLSGIPDANGVNLLYAGGVGSVPRHDNGF